MEFNGAKTNCGIAHILGILLTNSSDFQIFLDFQIFRATTICHLSSLNWEKIRRKRWRRREEETLLSIPTSSHCCFSFSYLFAPSPQSECLEHWLSHTATHGHHGMTRTRSKASKCCDHGQSEYSGTQKKQSLYNSQTSIKQTPLGPSQVSA